jgi:hypothetical protein
MKRLALALTLACIALPARAAETACNVIVDVTDTDPKGLNVRSMPAGRVVATLVDKADWIELHVIAQDGDWYVIDRANQIDNHRMGEEIVMWKGRGYVHKSTVGLSGLQNGANLYFDPDLKSHVVVQDAAGDQPTALLGCSGDFLRVKIGKGTGWTKEVCTNENTTCS